MKKPGWPWKIHFLVFSLYTFINMWNLAGTDSFLYLYYHILMAFHQGYRVMYGLAVLKVILNLLSLVPFFLFLFQIRFLSARFWQWLFALRVFFDLFGHAAEIKFFESLLHESQHLFFSYLFVFLVLVVPSYIVCFQYAFKQRRLFAP